MQQIPMDGAALGEIMMRGNSTMKGYYKNPRATNEAFKGGYFHTGDIALQHPDSYIQIADRAKDIIISGGENVSSVEVEGTLMHHPAVLLCAVVAKPDDKWGEVPCAFVELKEGRGRRGGADRLRPATAGRVQDAETRRVSGASQDLHRQDPEVRTAQGRRRALSRRPSSSLR
jgi:acyl-CoA synthetase (AMP-forming)/AMP-acid ligase II